MILLPIIICIIILLCLNAIKSFLYRQILFYSSQTDDEMYKYVLSKPNVKEFNIMTRDGENINGYIIFNSSSNKYILYSHGNAGNIYHRYNQSNFFKQLGEYNIVYYDYRGYGESTGIPSEKGIYVDIITVWKYLVIDLQINSTNIMLYGESLGCVASLYLVYYLLPNFDEIKTVNDYDIYGKLPSKMLLCSPFSSLKDVVYDLLSYTSVIIFENEFNNKKYIEYIEDKIPIMIIHSVEDELISHNHCLVLQEYNKFSKILTIKGSHNNPQYTNHRMIILKRFMN